MSAARTLNPLALWWLRGDWSGLTSRRSRTTNLALWLVPSGPFADNPGNSFVSRVHIDADDACIGSATHISTRARPIGLSATRHLFWKVWTWRPDRFMKLLP